MKLRPWHLLLVSIALYASACGFPALISHRPNPAEEPMLGIQCFTYGVLGIAVGWPLVCWIPNPWVILLWINVLRRRKTGPSGSWGGLVLAILVLPFLRYLPEYDPLMGAYLWLAAIATAGWATHLTDADIPG